MNKFYMLAYQTPEGEKIHVAAGGWCKKENAQQDANRRNHFVNHKQAEYYVIPIRLKDVAG